MNNDDHVSFVIAATSSQADSTVFIGNDDQPF